MKTRGHGSGIFIKDSSLNFLRPALEGWIEVNRRYCKTFDFKESIYWCNERGNVGALGAGAWLNDMVALEEYPHKTEERGNEKNGKPDLYISDRTNNYEAFVEAKLHWWGWPVGQNTEMRRINSLMCEACKQALDRKDENVRAIGAVFIVPGLLVKCKFGQEEMGAIRDKCGYDAISWYFAEGRNVMWDVDESCKKRRYYPGVVLLMKISKTPSA